MTANVNDQCFLARLRAGAKRIIEAIYPCLKKPKTDENAPDNDIEISSMTATSEETNLNRCATTDIEDAVSEHSELSDETYIRYRSDDSSDGRGQTSFHDMFPATATVHSSGMFDPKYTEDSSSVESAAVDSHLAVRPFTGTLFSDAEEIPRGPFYEPLVLTDIFFENDSVYVHLAEFFVFALNGNIILNVAIYLSIDAQ
ncbi:uncharacterized protein LOC106872864 [Octopus bimaculoides]|uniref:Uncharacterized protein n=2 Tax=Octopus bimaculoides TaxID=37653 RepID=A0A0L8H4D5_OCTBM|nr:uncharacterized protein LOC106872864 [Octopus bimaculoides]